MAASGVDGVLCPFCSIFHRFRQHFGRNSGYFFTNVVLELFYGPWLVNVNLWLQISPQEEVRRRQIGRTRWPVQITTFRHQTARKQFLQKIDCYATCVRWSAVLLKPELSHTLSTNNWHHKIGHHVAITLLVDGNSMAIFILEEKRPNDRFRTNAAPNCDFFVMKRHFLNLLRIFSGVNTAILLIYGPILGLTLQTRYVIKRSGISVKSYGVARWVRRIWTCINELFYVFIFVFG